MYTNAVAGPYTESCVLVGFCDPNPGRLEMARGRLPEGYPDVGLYTEGEFDRMIEDTKPETVVVTSKDSTHHKYIVRAMALGCDVICEKPLTTDAEKAQAIVDVKKKTGCELTVTHNARYSPSRAQVRRLLQDGVIGEVLSVELRWLLSTSHGADYFRRWHRRRENSGGLIVHKATHHFDLVNWWIGSSPVKVSAFGTRQYYLPETGDALGLTDRTDRCHTCPHARDGSCKFALNMEKSEALKAMYLDQEQFDGYHRDACIWDPEIDIEDTMNLVVQYASGATMSYSLNAFAPWEGYNVAFNGSRGRLEHSVVEDAGAFGEAEAHMIHKGTVTRVFPHFASPRDEEVWKSEGGHGGGDAPLLEVLFGNGLSEDDTLGQAAGLEEGIASILTGIAANRAMATGTVVDTASLVKL